MLGTNPQGIFFGGNLFLFLIGAGLELSLFVPSLVCGEDHGGVTTMQCRELNAGLCTH